MDGKKGRNTRRRCDSNDSVRLWAVAGARDGQPAKIEAHYSKKELHRVGIENIAIDIERFQLVTIRTDDDDDDDEVNEMNPKRKRRKRRFAKDDDDDDEHPSFRSHEGQMILELEYDFTSRFAYLAC